MANIEAYDAIPKITDYKIDNIQVKFPFRLKLIHNTTLN